MGCRSLCFTSSFYSSWPETIFLDYPLRLPFRESSTRTALSATHVTPLGFAHRIKNPVQNARRVL
ncbi:hypothetical protein GALMADRAFT_250550 [Galerina marginata CBS 339.88]|uniref:Uncharacterized protein n=1 Tax=Galerina marginata (strain CBS 339.88) TaxID=685588 RepID=A0A067SS94_GALM3|nr:hypothetical protein GALMADRAFT_250550 [Galerina marginata CBS 339.88]